MAERKQNEELTVITKTYDLILWSCQHTGKFPRNHRFVLGERIERNLYDLLKILIRAKYTRQRQELLEQANLVLDIFPVSDAARQRLAVPQGFAFFANSPGCLVWKAMAVNDMPMGTVGVGPGRRWDSH